MADWQQHEWKLLIGGELVAGEAGTAPIVNPATEEVVAEAPEASVAQAEEAARAAQEAFPAWSAKPAEERAALLKAAASRLEELGPDLVPLIISETGATATVGSRMQVPVALERFHRYARDATKSIGIPMPPQPVQATPLAPGGLMGAYVNRQPVGAVACISPYNFPLTNMVGKIAPALAVGCTVVMKPAPQDPLAIVVLAEVLHEVGFPPGVVTAIASVWGFHSGQICTAPTRAIVHRSKYDELVDKLAAAAGALKVGDPLDTDTIVGPVISAAQRDRIEAYVAAGGSEGADMVVDGRRPSHMERGYYVAPTLLAGCKPEMKPVKEEIFGPVVVVLPFDDDEEAVAIANSTDFGLYDYVMTSDTERGFRLAGRLRSGNVGINTAQRNRETPC